jgi:hypothetical protein
MRGETRDRFEDYLEITTYCVLPKSDFIFGGVLVVHEILNSNSGTQNSIWQDRLAR